MATFQVFISNFTGEPSVVPENGTLIYEIPTSPNDDNKLIGPKVKGEMGKAGSFEFALYPNNPYYDVWQQMVTMVRVTYFDKTIFYGRVLTIDKDHITFKKTIHCEGYLAFLLDSQFEGKSDDNREKTTGYKYIKALIDNHNSQVGGGTPNKTFNIGAVPGTYDNFEVSPGGNIVERAGSTNEEHTSVDGITTGDNKVSMPNDYRYGSSSWQDTSQAFSSLIKEYGGFLRTRWTEGNVVYLDWFNNYFDDNASNKILRVGENIVSIDSSSEVDNIFTAIIPVGQKDTTKDKQSNMLYINDNHKEIWVKDIGSHYTDEELNVGYHSKSDYTQSRNKYGKIYKVVSFPNAHTVEDLTKWAWDWVKENYYGGMTSFTVTAVDLAIMNPLVPALYVGDRCTVQYYAGTTNGNPNVIEIVRTVISAEYDLNKPENTTFTIGIPSVSLSKTYGESAKKTSSGGGGAAASNNDDVQTKLDKMDWERQIFWAAHVLSASRNSEEYQAYKDKYGAEAAGSILKGAEIQIKRADAGYANSQKDVATIVLNNQNGISMVDTTRVQGPVAPDRLKDYESAFTSLVVGTYNGLSFKDRNNLLPNINPAEVLNLASEGLSARIRLKKLDKHGGSDGTDTPPTESTTVITDGAQGLFAGMRAKFGATAGAVIDNLLNNGVPTVDIDGAGSSNEGSMAVGKPSGSSASTPYRVKLNNSVTYIDKNGQTRTATGFVSADDFQIKDLYDSLKVRLLVVNDLIADRATIGELNAVIGRVETIEADYITSQNIASTIGAIAVLDVLTLRSSVAISTPALSATAATIGTLTATGLTATTAEISTGLTYQGHLIPSTMITNITKNNAGDTLTITKLNGDTVTFKKAATKVTGGWSNGVFTVRESSSGSDLPCSSGRLAINTTQSGNKLTIEIKDGNTLVDDDEVTLTDVHPTSHTNCASGLTRYNNGNSANLYYNDGQGWIIATGSAKYWYYRSSAEALSTMYT